MKKILIGIVIVGIAIGGYFWGKSINLGGGMEASRDCDIISTSVIAIGASNATTILLATSGRSYARIQQARDIGGGYATSTPDLSFGGTAVSGSNFALSTTTPFIELGMTTDFPYTGAVTAITNTGSTTISVIECR